MHAASKRAQTADPSEHPVQFHDADHAAWARSVGRFLADGLERGEAVLVIARPEHRTTIVNQLSIFGCEADDSAYCGRLAFCDAGESLAKLMRDGKLDWDQFLSTVGGEMRRLIARSLNGGFRAYDEMVGGLWSAGKFSSAIRLEEYWNRLPQSTNFELFCGYPAQARDVMGTARLYYQSEKRFRALIENSTDAISLFDADGNITYASASTARVVGLQPHQLVGRNALELIHPDDRETVRHKLEEARANPNNPVQARARVLAKEEQWRWVEGTFTNLFDDPDVRALVANYRDITEQKAAEDQQRKQTEALARYNAELESFAYAATHDLREPLRTVSAFTQLLTQRSGSDKESEEYSKFILDSVAHMSSMLDDLLALTSVTSNHAREPVDLRRAVEQAVNYLEQAIYESGAAITLGALPCVLGNESQLTGLVQNLLGNAIKYGGAEPVRIAVTAEPHGNGWVIKVQDNGIGIAPAYHEQIFGLFKRLHQRSVPGTGIGLAICKKIVDGMGGRIWVESEPGKGSTFCFTAQAAPEN